MRIFDRIREDFILNYEKNKDELLKTAISLKYYSHIQDELEKSFYVEYVEHKKDLLDAINYFEKEFKLIKSMKKELTDNFLLEKEDELVEKFQIALLNEWFYFTNVNEGKSPWFMKEDFNLDGDGLNMLTLLISKMNKERMYEGSEIVKVFKKDYLTKLLKSKVTIIYETIEQEIENQPLEYINNILKLIGEYLNENKYKEEKKQSGVFHLKYKFVRHDIDNEINLDWRKKIVGSFVPLKTYITTMFLNKLEEEIKIYNENKKEELSKNMEMLFERISLNQIQLNVLSRNGEQSQIIEKYAYILSKAVETGIVPKDNLNEWFKGLFSNILKDNVNDLGEKIEVIKTIKANFYKNLYKSGELNINDLLKEKNIIQYEKILEIDKTLFETLIKFDMDKLKKGVEKDVKVSFTKKNTTEDELIEIKIITEDPLILSNEDILIVIKEQIEVECFKNVTEDNEQRKNLNIPLILGATSISLEVVSKNIIRELNLRNKLSNIDKSLEGKNKSKI